MADFREQLVEAQKVMSEYMQDFVQMQFSVELNMEVKSDQTAGPAFVWEPSVDLILQTQDSVVTGVEHLNEDARRFLVGFFSSVSNSIMASGIINDNSIAPWKGMEIEGTIFNGQYGWEGSEFIDYQITKRPGLRTIIGTIVVRDNDVTLRQCMEKAGELCDYILVFVHKPTQQVTQEVIDVKKEMGDKVIVRGILSRSATDTYLYPLCRTDTLVVPLSTDMFWSDPCIQEMSSLMRQMNLSGYRGVDIQDCVLNVTEIKSHPPVANGFISDHKVTYMGNVLKWCSKNSLTNLAKNSCVYRDEVDSFARINVSIPGIMTCQHINLSTTSPIAQKPDADFLEKAQNSEIVQVDASSFLPRKSVARLMRGSARWSVFNT